MARIACRATSARCHDSEMSTYRLADAPTHVISESKRLGLSTKPVVQNASAEDPQKNRRKPFSPRMAVTPYAWITKVARMIAAAKLAESASTWIPTCPWNWVAKIAVSGGVIWKKVSSDSNGASGRVREADDEHDRRGHEREAGEEDTELGGPALGLHPEREQPTEQRQEGNRPGGVVDAHPLSLDIAEGVDVRPPGAPPQEQDQGEAEAADAARHHDGECRKGVAGAGGPFIACVKPTSAITGAAKRSPIDIATPSGWRRARTP